MPNDRRRTLRDVAVPHCSAYCLSAGHGVDRSHVHSTGECVAKIIQAAAREACGLYTLEGVMKTSSDYHQPVLEALCAASVSLPDKQN